MDNKISRRDFVKGSAAAVAAVSVGSASLLRAEKVRPNVLLIMVDQMRTPRWTPELSIPNIEAMAARGVSFTRHFCSAVACSPSRACLVTGTYTVQSHLYQNVDVLTPSQPNLDPHIPTMGHVFGKAGYQTPYRGKWHLTRKKDRNKKDPLIDYGYTGWMDPDPLIGGTAYQGANLDPRYTRETVQWLGNPDNHKKPWLLTCSLVNPHDICTYPAFYPQERLKHIHTAAPADNWTDDLSGKPRIQAEFRDLYAIPAGRVKVNSAEAWRRYLDFYVHCTETVDQQIGQVLEALDKSGQRDNTIVVFTADHGEAGGSHQLRTKGPFAYEEVINVPLIFSWPGHIPEGKTTAALANNVDVMPTIAGLAGIGNMPYQAGLDLSPVLADPARPSAREDVLYHVNGDDRPPQGGILGVFKSPGHVRSIRTAQWKFVHYFTPGKTEEDFELYNLKDDPLEMKNLAQDPGYREKCKEMQERLTVQEGKLKKDFSI